MLKIESSASPDLKILRKMEWRNGNSFWKQDEYKCNLTVLFRLFKISAKVYILPYNI